MAYYKINGDTLTAIADRTRVMAGICRKLTPAQIIYWLGRVIFLPQSHAFSIVDGIWFCSSVQTRLPDVQKAATASTVALSFDSTASIVTTQEESA